VLVAAWVLAIAGVATFYAVQANTWAVMTDELQVARLATSIADTLSPVPTIRGEHYGANSQLYPLLLAPLYGVLSAPQAAMAAHALNGLLLASAALPAFLLGRAVTGRSAVGYAAAALTGVTPWLALSSTLLTENAAYPAFVWSVFLCHRALVRPSARGDLAALAGLGLAYAARTQLVVVAVALPFALVLHELSLGSVEHGLRGALAVAYRRHRVLVAAYACALALAAVLVVAGGIGGVVGNYTTTFGGDLVPAGLWRATAEHLDQVAIAVGLLPVVLSTSWVATALAHRDRSEEHAFASLFVVLVPLLLLEVASFDVRFTPRQFIQDRYLIYLVPLFAVACAAWLAERDPRHTRTRDASALAAGAALVALLALTPHGDDVIFWAAPGGAFRPAIRDTASALHVSDTVLVQVIAALSVVLVVVLARRSRSRLVAVTLAVTAFGALQTFYVLDRSVVPSMIRSDVADRDWIDRVVPDGGSVALVPGGVGGPVAWWEAELWNETVDRELRIGRRRTFTPFPVLEASIDDADGRLAGPDPSGYLVIATDENRFGIAGSVVLARRGSLTLLRVERPYRLAWSALGLTSDGWTRPGQATTIRVFGHREAGRRAVVLTLAASRFSPRPVDFALVGDEETVVGTVDPGGARPPVQVTVCVPAGGHVDVRLVSRRGVDLPDGRRMALHVDRMRLSPSWSCAVS
jgi:hypothetical protein